jgi:hypothetical protein
VPSRRSRGRRRDDPGWPVILAALVVLVVVGYPLWVLAEATADGLAGLAGRRPVPDFLVGVAIGAAPVGALVVIRQRGRAGVRRAWRGVWGLLLVTLSFLMIAAAPSRFRPNETTRARVRRPYVASGVFPGLFLGLLVLGAATSGNPLIAMRAVRGRARPRPGHTDVQILNPRPAPGESWTSYYVALCECGWTAKSVHESDVRHDAAMHAPGVEPLIDWEQPPP